MKRTCRLAIVMITALSAAAMAGNWPQFRGPTADNIAHERHAPINWSGEQNVAWKVALPAGGNGSPIVWSDRVIIPQAIGEGGARRGLICFDRNTGKKLWETFIDYADDEPTHNTNPYCAPTPVTDGERIYAWFGSAGLAAFDFDGNVVWHRDLGPVRHQWGHGSSPVLFEDMVIQYVGPGPVVSLVALSKQTGQPIYRRELTEATGTEKEFKGCWATPVIVKVGGEPQMLVNLPNRLVAFNPHTGHEYWRCEGLGDLSYASVMVSGDTAVAMSGYGGPAIACRLPDPSASGDITQTHRLWRHEKNQQRIGTGVIFRDWLHTCDEPGILRCYEVASGKLVYEQRLGKATWGSTLLVGGRLYITDTMGTTYVVKPGPEFEVIATNALPGPEVTRSTPAFSDGQMFLRTYDHLWCFGTRIE